MSPPATISRTRAVTNRQTSATLSLGGYSAVRGIASNPVLQKRLARGIANFAIKRFLKSSSVFVSKSAVRSGVPAM